MKKRNRLVLGSYLLGLGIVMGASAQAEPRPYTQQPTVSFRALAPATDPHPLNPHVRYVGGYELTGNGTSRLTGLSDLQLTPDGDTLHVEANSDWGWIVRFDLKPDGKGGMANSPLEIDDLKDANGQPLMDKTFGDAEDIAYDPASGARFVSYEGVQRIERYPQPETWRGQGTILPLTGLANFPENFGMEGLTYVRDKAGDYLLIGVEAGGYWRCPVATWACTEVDGPAVPGFMYMTTSLAVLDYNDPRHDHDVLALYRFYTPFTGPRNILRLLHSDGNKLTVVEDLAKIAPPLPYDNFEGVAAIRTATGYRLYLVSDGLHEADKPKILMFDWTE